MIDPKTLHIGSHILVNGKQVEIESIINDSQIGCYTPNYDDWFGCDPREDSVEPIPITKELLTELGFLKMEEHGSVSVWMRRNIRIDFYGTRITAMVGNDYNKCEISSICHLHELEAFLYLTAKTELIKE